MRDRSLSTAMAVAITAAAVSALILASITPTSAQAQANVPTVPSPILKTPWGEPDLQGIWTEETDTPLQRPAKYADQELFSAAERAELDTGRAGRQGQACGARD
jgi:hypothetical protein